MPVSAPSLRRPFIYPHRSARMLPRVGLRLASAIAGSAALTYGIWHYLEALATMHNAIAFTLVELAGVPDVRVIDTIIAGRMIPVLATVPGPVAVWTPYAAVAVVAAVLIALAIGVPLARGMSGFVLTVLGLSVLAFQFEAPGLSEFATFPIVWTHTEILVWLVLPSMTALLFVTVQPSWVRGVGWMMAVEAFAIFWSAARLVVVLGVAQVFGSVLLPALWFVLGMLADVLYVTMFYSLAVHVNLRLTPERRR